MPTGASAMPEGLDTFLDPLGTDLLANAVPGLVHHSQHDQANDAIKATERIVVGPTWRNPKSDEYSGGAKGDGVSVDTAAFNALFTAAPAGGICMRVPPGVYLVDANLLLSKPLLVEGAGAATIIKATGASFDVFELQAAAAGSRFKNLQIWGAATDSTTGQHGIHTDTPTAASDLWIEGVTFSGPDSSHGLNNGVKLGTGADNPHVSGCTFKRLIGNLGTGLGAGYGVYGGQILRGQFSSNTFIGTPGNGRHAYYFAAGAAYCNFDNTVVDSYNESAIHLRSAAGQPACVWNRIDGAIIVGGGSGTTDSAAIQVFGICQHNNVSDVAIDGFNGFGVSFNNFAAGAGLNLENTLDGFEVFQTQWAGVVAIGTTDAFFRNGKVRDCSQLSAGYQAGALVGPVGSGTQYAATGTRFVDVTSYGANQRAGLEISAGAPNSTGTRIEGGAFGVGTTGSEVLTNGMDYVRLTVGAIAETSQALLTGHGATGARPSASSVGQGAQWFDMTLGKPIWSDGANWRDAAGNVV